MRRRSFMAGAGSAALLPVAARAQTGAAPRRVTVLTAQAEGDPLATIRLQALRNELQRHGWQEGRNLRLAVRWTGASVERLRQHAAELAQERVDVVVTHGGFAARAMRDLSTTIPIVFVVVTDPVGQGLITSIARPQGNITGFTGNIEGIETKWIEMLADVKPGLKRVAVLGNPPTWALYPHLMSSLERASAKFGVSVNRAITLNGDEIDDRVAGIAKDDAPGIIVPPDGFTVVHRKRIIAAIGRHRIPAIYPYGYFAREGGLIAYGIDIVDLYRRSADYIDKILRGTPPGELPVQQPTRFELVINLKTAQAQGIEMPAKLLALANEVIE